MWNKPKNLSQIIMLFVLAGSMDVTLAQTGGDDADREALRLELENLIHTGRLSSSEVQLAARDLLLEIYERRDFLPTWNDQRQIAELIVAIRATEADGLDPADYHLEQVQFAYQELLAGRLSEPQDWAPQDLILTDSLIRLGYHQSFGKVNPYTLDPNWNFRRELNDVDPATVFLDAVDAPSLTEFLQSVFPRGWVYRQLQAGLAEYRQIATAGGWPLVPSGPTLAPGASDARLEILAQRLAVTGDLDNAQAFAGASVYDEALQEGVRRFQDRHGIDVDAVIGPATLRALNVPVEERIRQFKINLERARWVVNDLGENFIVVNIAGFHAYLVRNREITWETRVQVGASYHQTPVFRDEMKYLVLNPTWTVPYSIATREILPRIKRDDNYFATRDFDVKDRSGNLIDASDIGWSDVSARNFPYWLVQRPGPNNALGRVKFMFPNEHAVYLHDTPSKSLFGRAERAFSHGCIRTENPLELAELLLDSPDWDQQALQNVIDGGETKTVFLQQPLPILLLYWTAVVEPDGITHFYSDVYSRDDRIGKILDEPFQLDLPGR
jgi:murein L,D-transpeptidase YcbB/YkuD